MGDIPWPSPHTARNAAATTCTLAGRKEGERKEVPHVICHQMAVTYLLNPILPQTMSKPCPLFSHSLSLSPALCSSLLPSVFMQRASGAEVAGY